jgi:hypothetical protein
VRTRELLRKIDRTLDRMDEHMSRGNELMDQMREEHRLNRQEHRLNREQYHRLQQESLRQERRSQAAIERNTRVMRELLLQRQEDRVFLERIEQGIHAQTQGLLHVLDELRNGRGGPDAAPAG